MLLSYFKRRRQGLIFFALLLLLSAAAGAKDQPDIQIFVTDKPEPKMGETAQAEVLRPKDIAGQVLTVTDILERATGVQLKQYGGLDDFATVSIRGSTTDQVLVYLDGILLNSAQGDILDLSFIPTSQIDRIEVYRGGSPGKAADATLGGVILITTRKKPEKTENEIDNAFGSFTTYRGDIRRTEAVGDVYYHLSYNRFQSEGDFPYLDDNGTRTNTGDDRVVTRQNNDFASNTFIGILGRESKEGVNWKIFENFFQKEQGIPGLGPFTSTNARLATLRNTTYFKMDHKAFGREGGNWEGFFFFDFLNNRFQDPNGEIGLGVQDNNNLTFRGGPEWHATLPLPHQILSAFLVQRSEFFLPTNKNTTPAEGPLSQRYTVGVGIEDAFHFLEDKIILDPSVRFQIFLNHLSGADPSLPTTTPDNDSLNKEFSAKLGIKIAPWRFLHFKANIYRGFRQPTFNELFGDRGTFVGNPALQPERGLNFDMGLSGHFRNVGVLDDLFVDMVFFRQSVDDLIQFVQTSQFTVQSQNFRSALITGGEFAVAMRLFERLRLSGNYVYQSAKDASATSPTRGKFLPGRPKNQFYLQGEYRYRFLRPFAQWQGLSDNYLDSQNLLKVSRRNLVTAGLTLEAAKWVTLSFSAKNLLNDRAVDVLGFPLPGRSYWGELALKL